VSTMNQEQQTDAQLSYRSGAVGAPEAGIAGAGLGREVDDAAAVAPGLHLPAIAKALVSRET
jgi:hypothetical protein